MDVVKVYQPAFLSLQACLLLNFSQGGFLWRLLALPLDPTGHRLPEAAPSLRAAQHQIPGHRSSVVKYYHLDRLLSDRLLDHLPTEDFSKMARQARLDGIKRDYLPGQTLERGDAFVGYAARHYQIEIIEVGFDVECKAMHSDPARNTDTDSGQLLAAYPDSRETLDPFCLDPEVGGSPDHHLFEVAHVPMNITPVGG